LKKSKQATDVITKPVTGNIILLWVFRHVIGFDDSQGIRKHFDAQTFATDIDATAIEVARKGVYPESIAVDVSKKRLDHKGYCLVDQRKQPRSR